MNAPVLTADIEAFRRDAPEFLKRKQPARYGWWSDRTLMVVKGDETMTLDADDLAALRRFFDRFDTEGA